MNCIRTHENELGRIIVHLPGVYAYFPNVFLRVFSRTFLRLILKQKKVRKAIDALWAKHKKRQWMNI